MLTYLKDPKKQPIETRQLGISLAMNWSRLTQDALRTASGPLRSDEIAAAVMQAKGMPPGDAALKEIVGERALTVLRRLVKRGASGEVRGQP